MLCSECKQSGHNIRTCPHRKECPICYEELSKDDIKFASCGHKYCETCLSKIDNCAICRKKIYSKK